MSEFKIIETQEQLDAVIGERLKRERETVKKQYEGYLSPDDVTKKYEGFLSPDDVTKKYEKYLSPEEAAAKDAKIKGYETSSVKMKIAHEVGIPFELAERLTGEDEAAIRKDAEAISKFMKSTHQAPPLFDTEPSGNNKEAAKNAAFKKMISEMEGD